MDNIQDQPVQTLGERRVRTSFNPTNNGVVDKIKQDAAKLINDVDNILRERLDPERDYSEIEISEQTRLVRLAQTALEEAAMWAVKAATI